MRDFLRSLLSCMDSKPYISLALITVVDDYFSFVDGVILEINAKPYTWYQDPLMPPDMKSMFSYDDIKPEDIKEI